MVRGFEIWFCGVRPGVLAPGGETPGRWTSVKEAVAKILEVDPEAGLIRYCPEVYMPAPGDFVFGDKPARPVATVFIVSDAPLYASVKAEIVRALREMLIFLDGDFRPFTLQRVMFIRVDPSDYFLPSGAIGA